MGESLRDLRQTLRHWLRAPVFVLTAVLTLAIGMGVNAVAFSVVNALLFKGTMARGIPGVGRIATTPDGDEGGYASSAELQQFVAATRGALDVAAEGRAEVAWRHDGTTDTAWALFVSDNYFTVVPAPVIAGRLTVSPGASGFPAAVIGERFWRDRLGSASLTGLSLVLNSREVAVAGVIPEAFTGPGGLYSPDVWLALDDAPVLKAAPSPEKRDARWLFLVGRLRPDASVAQIQGQLDTAATGMALEWPETHTGRGASFWMLDRGNRELRGLRTAASIAMSIIGLVLLLACFNVANLLLARAADRERDLGIRAALGAGPGRLMRLVLVEGLAISGISGALALLVAWWTRSLVGSFAIPIEQPQYVDLAPDLRVVGFIAVLVVVAGVLPGLWPALSAARIDVLRVLGSQGANAGGARPAGLRRWLVGAQVAGSTAFLALTALFVQSYAYLGVVDLGFDRDHLVVAELTPAAHGYNAARAERYLRLVSARVAALPGVRSVTVSERAPFFIGVGRTIAVWPTTGSCEPIRCPTYAVNAVDPVYFSTLGIGLAEGLGFEPGRTAGTVVINGRLARAQWPDGASAVGRTLRIGPGGQTLTVVGVTTKSQIRGLDRETPAVYVPLTSADMAGPLTLVVRTEGAPESLVRPVREAAQAVDPDIALTSVSTMRRRADVQLWPFRTVSWMFGVCGVLALALATVGLAGVVMHAVSRRLREFGIRMSLGATRRDLALEVLRGTVWLLVPGVLVGMTVAAVMAQLARVALVGVNVQHSATYLAVAALQCAVVLVACLGPALRASRVDPMVAVRAQ